MNMVPRQQGSGSCINGRQRIRTR